MTIAAAQPSSGREALASLTNDELATLIDDLEAREAAVRTLKLDAIAVYAEREAWREDYVPSMSHWLMFRHGVKKGTSNELVRVANALGDLPAIREAAETGELSWDQLRPLTKIATPEEDGSLAREAPHRSPWDLERAARRKERITADEALDQRAERRLKLRKDLDRGSLTFWGRLAGDGGQLFERVLHKYTDRLPKDPDTGAYGSLEQQLADALVLMAQDALGSHGDRVEPEVVVHMDADVFLGGDGRCELECGPQIAPETAKRLACDARMLLVIQRDGRAIGIGRTSRSVPPSMARAILDRDGACRVCGGNYWLQIHHIIHFSCFGTTDMHNLVTVCSLCHTQLHEGGWRIEGDPVEPLTFVHDASRTVYGEGRRLGPLPEIRSASPDRHQRDGPEPVDTS